MCACRRGGGGERRSRGREVEGVEGVKWDGVGEEGVKWDGVGEEGVK